MRDAPDRNALSALHDRLLRGDRLASEELSRLILPVTVHTSLTSEGADSWAK
jgi:hypothetical protein